MEDRTTKVKVGKEEYEVFIDIMALRRFLNAGGNIDNLKGASVIEEGSASQTQIMNSVFTCAEYLWSNLVNNKISFEDFVNKIEEPYDILEPCATALQSVPWFMPKPEEEGSESGEPQEGVKAVSSNNGPIQS